MCASELNLTWAARLARLIYPREVDIRINNSPEASSTPECPPLHSPAPGSAQGQCLMAQPLSTHFTRPGEHSSCPHYTPDTEMVIIIGDNLGAGGNIGVMASKCGRITHPEVLMPCLVLVCSGCLRCGSFLILWPGSPCLCPRHLHGDADY